MRWTRDVRFRSAAAIAALLAAAFGAQAAASGGSRLSVSATVVRSVAISVQVGPSAQPVISIRTARGSTFSTSLASAPSGVQATARPASPGQQRYLLVTVQADATF
jgi:hypothetical protein